MKHIMILEDDVLTQKTLARIFDRSFKVSICNSGEEFLANFMETKFDFFIMDISLKGKYNGLEITRLLRESELHTNTPILCLTAHAFRKDQLNALEAGVSKFLTKPIEPAVLRKVVEGMLTVES